MAGRSPARSPTPRCGWSTTRGGRRRVDEPESRTSRPSPGPDAPRGRLGRRTCSGALVATGFGYAAGGAGPKQAEMLRGCSRRCATSGASAVPPSTSCAVAEGPVDAFAESGLNAWDLAAGWLIVEEAGGVVVGGPHGQGPHGRGMTGARRAPASSSQHARRSRAGSAARRSGGGQAARNWLQLGDAHAVLARRAGRRTPARRVWTCDAVVVAGGAAWVRSVRASSTRSADLVDELGHVHLLGRWSRSVGPETLPAS